MCFAICPPGSGLSCCALGSLGGNQSHHSNITFFLAITKPKSIRYKLTAQMACKIHHSLVAFMRLPAKKYTRISKIECTSIAFASTFVDIVQQIQPDLGTH